MAGVLGRLHPEASRRSNLVPAQLPPSVRTTLHDAAVTEDHLLGLVVWWAATPVMTLIGAVLLGPWTVLLGALMAALPFVLVAARSGRRVQLVVDQLPETIDMIGRSLRSGASLHQSFIEVAGSAAPEIGHELRTMLSEIERGQPTSRALRSWAGRMPRSEVRVAAAALALASEHEGGAVQALDGVSQTLRDRAALVGEIRALISQAVSSMRAMLLLPFGFLAIDGLGDKQVLSYLVNERIGRFCLVGGMILNVIGAGWMHLIVKRRLPT